MSAENQAKNLTESQRRDLCLGLALAAQAPPAEQPSPRAICAADGAALAAMAENTRARQGAPVHFAATNTPVRPEEHQKRTYSLLIEPVSPVEQRAQSVQPAEIALGAEQVGAQALDPQLGRLAVTLGLAAPLFAWLISRNPSGYTTRDTIQARLERHGAHYGERQLRRIMSAGEGLFWHVHKDRQGISLRSVKRVGAALVQRAKEEGKEELYQFEYQGVTYTNLPGMRPVYIQIQNYTLQRFKAEIYAAWLQHRTGPISRAVLCRLFAVTEDTLRNWERMLVKAGRLEIREAYAKAFETPEGDTAQALAAKNELPSHAFTYDVFVQTKRGWEKERRLSWRLPNLYITHEVREHSARGQSRKVRAAARAMLSALKQPVLDVADGSNADETADREHRERCYYDKYKRAAAAHKKGTGRLYLYFQGYRLNKARFELLTASERQTALNELSPHQAVALMRQGSARRARIA